MRATGVALAAILAGATSARAAVPPITVEFSEAAVANGTNLVGSNAFAAEGLHFTGSATYILDPALIGAGTDNAGITTGLNPNFMGVTFDGGATSVTFAGVTLNTEFVATAFDSSNNVLDTFSAPSVPGLNYLTHTFSGVGDIARVEFHDNAQFIAVGRIEYTVVPEPTMLGTLGAILGLPLLAARQRRGRR
ncbi:MAG TPA: hypothetical protein VH518_22620 [Tepidisphaeraceae bacterium]|jgi:hypothetical protein